MSWEVLVATATCWLAFLGNFDDYGDGGFGDVMKRTTFILCLLFLNSCQSISDARLGSYETERQAYFQCGYSAGQRLSRRSSEPYYVVTAAKMLCEDKRTAMIDKIMKAHDRSHMAADHRHHGPKIQRVRQRRGRQLSRDIKLFLQFIAALILFGLAGNAFVSQNWPRSYALPFGLLWVFALLVTMGFIIDGKEGAKALFSTTLLMWTLAVIGAAFIAWMAIAGADHTP
jgi:cation transport ATPase